MKAGQKLLLFLAILAVLIIPIDLLYSSNFVSRFKKLEKERIAISNQLATAKIVSENLEHVRDLVFRNMTFPGQKETITQESALFDFLTTCVNDLKLRLVSIRPMVPTVDGRVTTYGYDIQLEGDFFSFGELCAKLENSQRVLALTSFEVSNPGKMESDNPGRKINRSQNHHGAVIRMHLDMFRVRKGT